MHSFILHWQDQVRKYVALDPQQNTLQDNFLLTMLQNVVNPVEELRIVKTQAEQMSVTDGMFLLSFLERRKWCVMGELTCVSAAALSLLAEHHAHSCCHDVASTFSQGWLCCHIDG